MSEEVAKPTHTVSVRDLVEFVLRRGDLGGGGEFVGSGRALAGIRGHQKIQRSRPTGYLTEIPVMHSVEVTEFILQIRGRIDGLLITTERTLLEEIKTVPASWPQAADSLHWAQAKFYGFMYAQEQGLKEIDIQLVYLELPGEEITEFRETFSFVDLSEFVSVTTTEYVDWLKDRHHWGLTRNASIATLVFPYPQYRPGQRELAVAAYRVVANGGRLFLAAPTGIGKTISTLFPAIKALKEARLERIFYLTARTVGRTIAEKALGDLRGAGLRLRSLTLTAKEKICVREGHACDPLTCPLARGYYDRVKPAIREALALEEITRLGLEAVGQKHQVCPFELSLDVSVWVDAIICDYNYVFDPQAFLHRHFAEDGGAYAFLVDEAHNLVDRARAMYSASIEGQELLDLKRAIRRAAPRCANALGQLNTVLRKLSGATDPEQVSIEASDPTVELDLFPVQVPAIQRKDGGVSTSRAFPESILQPLETALAEAEKWLVKNQPAEFREALLGLYFRLHAFRRTAEDYDDRFVTIIENDSAIKLRLFCLDPSLLLRKALARGQAAVFFSATLTPIDFYRTLLGGTPDDPALQLASPFPPENLAVVIHDRIQTQFKVRSASLGEVVAAIGTLVNGRPGNYLVYFPSYQYLNDVLPEFRTAQPTVQVLVQRSGMTETERDGFLAAFSVERGDTLVGFAVLGGIFGEGIDLVGERLIGAVIVGVGLPQLCIERDLIRDHFHRQNSAGFEYAYTFPGMNRVLQALGRVIRSESDRGVVLLIDARFSEPRYRRLFPPWWKYVCVRHSSGLHQAVSSFWKKALA